jgi:hypothetical protein
MVPGRRPARLLAAALVVSAAGLGGCATSGQIWDINTELRALDGVEELTLQSAAPMTRSAVEARVGAPDYLMPSQNVAVYTNYRIGGRYEWESCERRRLYAIHYQDDVVQGAWYGFIIGDLGGAGGAELFADRLEMFAGGPEFFDFNPAMSRRESVFGSITVGRSTRADVLALAGAPYYVAPAHDIAVYIASTAPGGTEVEEEDEDEPACIGDGCLDRVVVTAQRPCPRLSVRGLRAVWYAAQYDENGTVLRFERLQMTGDFHLDEWVAAGELDD